MSYFIVATIFRLITSRSVRDPPLYNSVSLRPSSRSDKDRNSLSTVAILAQGTSWAVADTQAFLPGGSIPTRIKSQSTLTSSNMPLLCSGWRSQAAREKSNMLREKWAGALGGPSYQTSAM